MLQWWTPTVTRLHIAAIVAYLLVMDVVLAAVVGNDATWSKQMQWISREWPIVMVAWGGLGAHFFVPRYDAWPGWWTYGKPILCLALGFVAFLAAWSQLAPPEN
jgi:hypothetical protein